MMRPNGIPLFAQILALLLAAVLLSQAANLALVFASPPPDSQSPPLAEVAKALSTGVSGETGLALRTERTAPFDDREDERESRYRASLANALGRGVQDVAVVNHASPGEGSPGKRGVGPPPRPQPAGNGGFGRPGDQAFVAALRLPDGRWRWAESRPGGLLTAWQRRALIWLALSLILILPLGWWLARRLSAPIRSFAAAAERLGRDPRTPRLELDGPPEIRAAASAFNLMQERLGRYVEDRTAMVGAIAHDLRTPLTRLAFRLEDAPSPLREKAAADIEEMQAMIGAALDFVRDVARPPARVPLDLYALVESVAGDLADLGVEVTVESGERLVINGDPAGLKRLVVNLIENASKYAGSATARVRREGEFAVLELDDRGPGLPEHELSRVFEPFRRGESSRSRDTGGIGLGLAVVRTIARAHGGDAELLNLAGGGLRARVKLPI